MAPTPTPASSPACGRICAKATSARTTLPDGLPSSTAPQGDIDTLQGRIAAIRSWAYICQRPDWVLARDEMAARARAAEARLSDALHQRLTERFVNRRTAILMKTMGKDSALLRVALDEQGRVMVEGEPIGHLEGFRFVVDALASSEERKLMLAAAERHMPRLLAEKAQRLVASELGDLAIQGGKVMRGSQVIATIERAKSRARPAAGAGERAQRARTGPPRPARRGARAVVRRGAGAVIAAAHDRGSGARSGRRARSSRAPADAGRSRRASCRARARASR